jgi:anaerobic ribonucleoside-triphosphate reductase
MKTINKTTTQRQKCEIWTRVMGYHRTVSHFNKGKKSEHAERQHFEECASLNSNFCEKF